jgi:hypothetical protein
VDAERAGGAGAEHGEQSGIKDLMRQMGVLSRGGGA